MTPTTDLQAGRATPRARCAAVTKAVLGDRFLDPWRVARSGPASELLNDLRQRLSAHDAYKPRRPDQLGAWHALLDLLAVNLALAVVEPPPSGRLVAAANYRRAARRYRNPVIGKGLLAALRLFEAAGLAEMALGRRQGSEATTYRATPKMASLVAQSGVQREDFGWSPQRGDPVVLTRQGRGPRGSKSKVWVDYADTARTIAMRHEMNRVNEYLAGLNLDFVDDGAGPVDTDKRWLSRRFTVLPDQPERFDQCGRLFGGFWETLPRTRRSGLRINGEPCVALDYGSMFARLALAEARAEPAPGDLYDVPGLEALTRDQRKAAFNVFLFTRAGCTVWPKALFDDDASGGRELPPFPCRWTPYKVRRAILDRHPALAAAFNVGSALDAPLAGYRLMFLESQLLLALLLEMVRQGLASLPLHDALLVPLSATSRVKALMEDMALSTLGCPIPVSSS